MPGYRTIDPATPDHADALCEDENARRSAWAAYQAQVLARHYSSDRPGIGPDEVMIRIDGLLTRSVAACLDESKALKRLNAILLHAGGEPGDEFSVGRQVYRVCSPGQLAVHLGAELPADLDPEDISREAEIGEHAYEYARATKFEG